MPPHIARRTTHGFTLVELLVVVSIIALLLSILLPAVNRALGIARQVACKSNQKQIGLGIALYHQDNNYVYPSSDNPTGGTSNSIMWKGRVHRALDLPMNRNSTLSPQNFTESIWACPSLVEPTGATVKQCYKVAEANLGDTWGVIHVTGGRPFHEITAGPANVMIMRENSTIDDNSVDGFWGFPSNEAQLELPGRHGDVQNILFADGHVDTLDNNWASGVVEWRRAFKVDIGVER